MTAMRALAGGLLAATFFVSSGLAQTPAPASQGPQPAAAPAAVAAGRGQQAPLPPALLGCPELSAALRGVAERFADERLAQLARYREVNHGVTHADVVLMGDSITDNWAQPRFSDVFFPGKGYLGRGISGQTTPQMLIRMKPDVLRFKPKVVVFLAGTNDIAGNTGPMTDEEIEFNLAAMSELVMASGAKVVLTSITPVGAYHTALNGIPQTTQRPVVRVRAINDWMKSYASAHHQVYVDYYSAMIDSTGMMKAEFTADDLHPNAAGYAVMMPLAQAGIDAALKLK